MDKEKIKSQLEILEWVIRLSYCGMPVSYFRHMLLKKHEELESQDRQNSAPILAQDPENTP